MALGRQRAVDDRGGESVGLSLPADMASLLPGRRGEKNHERPEQLHGHQPQRGLQRAGDGTGKSGHGYLARAGRRRQPRHTV